MNTDDTSLKRPGYWFGVIEYRLREKMRETFMDLDLSRGEWRILHALVDGPITVDDIEAALPPGDRHRRMGARASGRPGHGYGPWAWGGFGPGYGGGRGYGPWTWAGRGYGPGSWPGFGPAFGPGYGRWFQRGFAPGFTPGEGEDGASASGGTEAGSDTPSSAGAESSSGTANGSAAASGSGSAEAGPDAHPEQAGPNGPHAHAEHTGHDWHGRYGWHPGHHGPDAHHGHEAHDGHGAASADRPEHGDRREHRRPRSVAEVLVDFAERGWVVLDNTGATLTDAGRAVHDEAQSRVRELRASVTEGISEDDYRTMIATLEKMARNVGWSEEAEAGDGEAADGEAAGDEAAGSDQTQADGDAPEVKPDAEA